MSSMMSALMVAVITWRMFSRCIRSCVDSARQSAMVAPMMATATSKGSDRQMNMLRRDGSRVGIFSGERENTLNPRQQYGLQAERCNSGEDGGWAGGNYVYRRFEVDGRKG